MNPHIATFLLPLLIGITVSTTAQDRFDYQFSKDPLNLRHFRFLGPRGQKAIQQSNSGLDIKLPFSDAPGERAGIGTKFGIEGDFEITIGYELIEVKEPDKGYGAGVMLALVTVDEPAVTVNMAHRKKKNGELFIGTNVWTMVDSKMKNSVNNYSTDDSVSRGQLRLVRNGSSIRFLLAEGNRGDFRELRRSNLGPQPVRAVQIWGDSGGSSQPVKVRLTSLSIRAGQLPYGPQSRQQSSIWKIWAILGLLGTAALAGCGFWYWSRPRKS